MAIQGPDVVTRFIADISEFVRGTQLAQTHLRKSTKEMEGGVGQFADSMDRQGHRISGSWWKRFGTVALGFTIAYRAMNVFENGLMKLGETIKESIRQSGQLAEQQAKNAFWMTVFADRTITFSDAFKIAAGSINALREESVRSISSIDELMTGIDELAQAGLPIEKRLIPHMVSLVDFTGMVAQTVGSTTRQIRQEVQALMDGTVRVTNQVVRVMKNMGVLTEQNLKDLRNMVNRAEIFEKVVKAIHDRWLAMVETMIKASPERAFAYWEKSIQKVLIQSVLLASELKGVENIFGETLYNAAVRFREGIRKIDMDRLIYLMNTLNKGLDALTRLFNNAVTGIATVVTVTGNLIRELNMLWRILGDLTVFVLATKAIEVLGKMMLWIVAGPIKLLAKAALLVLSPWLLVAAALTILTTTVIGHISFELKRLKIALSDSEGNLLSWRDVFRTSIKDEIDKFEVNPKVIEFFVITIPSWIKTWKEFISSLKGPTPYELLKKAFGSPSEWEAFKDAFFAGPTGFERIKKALEDSRIIRMPIIPSVKMPMPIDIRMTEKQIKEVEKLAEELVNAIRPTPTALEKAKEYILNAYKGQANAFKEGLKILRGITDPEVKRFVEWFDNLFMPPKMEAAGKAADEAAVAFRKMFPALIFEEIKKMGREMKKFEDEIPAFVNALDAFKKGLIHPEDLAEFAKSEKIIETYYRRLDDVMEQMAAMPAGVEGLDFVIEFEDLRDVVEEWKGLALAHNAAQYALRRYQDQYRLLKDVQDEYNRLVMTGRDYELWALDEEIEKMRRLTITNKELIKELEKASFAAPGNESITTALENLRKLTLGNEELTNAIEQYANARGESIKREFSGLAELAEGVASDMEKSFSDLFFDVMTVDWKDLGSLAENTLRAMQRDLANFLAQASREYFIGAKTGMGTFGGGALGGIFDWIFKGGTPDIYSPFYEAPVYNLHQGGKVGEGFIPTRMMPASLLENAIRLHTGLRSNEFPAILEKGETVYPKNENPIEVKGILRAMQNALTDFLARVAQGALTDKQINADTYISKVVLAAPKWLLGGSKATSVSKDASMTEIPWAVAHQGWSVGSGYAPSRMLPMSLLENAVRLHTGLRGDEYPAILKGGERVYAKGESPIEGITIINNTGFTPQVTETKSPGGGRDIRIVIGEIIAGDIYQGGPASRAIKSAYGLRTQTLRR